MIAVDSKPGTGSVFSVCLPAVVDIVEMSEKTGEPVPDGNARILFVDDEEILTNMWSDILDDLGYRNHR